MRLDLPVPDHSTLSRRARTLAVAPQVRTTSGPVHLLVDSTRVKLSGPGEWLVEKHGTQRRRAWRKLHLGVDAKTGTIVASTLTSKEVDDAAKLESLPNAQPWTPEICPRRLIIKEERQYSALLPHAPEPVSA
jgi:hypothetical protein